MYNQGQNAIVFMEVLSMNEALKTQLKILKLSDIKPNFSELARFYDLDRRTAKKYYDGYEGKAAHRDKANLINIMLNLLNIFLAKFYIISTSVFIYILSRKCSGIMVHRTFSDHCTYRSLHRQSSPFFYLSY